ncbi:MAG: penicillin-binding protein activator LpoB [Candidatus Cloacimonetes bacterium]|nr:penicillin-binding protein activator LpoB [Candidatus Cloacimonadota bacterium]
MKRVMTLLSVIALLTVLGCAQQTRSVSRISTDEVTDLRGDWNDTDSRLVAEQMVKDLLYRPWLSNFVSDEDRQPVVIVGTVRNKSTEHIQTETFIKDIERELINSGKVEFVADAKARKEIRNERMEQQSYASDDSAKRLAAESGADFMLQGTITSNVDAIGGKEAKFYQVDLELINVESNKKVWIGSKEIKKFVQKSKTKW